MVFKVADIIKDVRVALNENPTAEELIAELDSETLNLDQVIESCITDAVKSVHSVAPAHLLECGHNFAEASVSWGEYHRGSIILPDDFLRLVSFKMSDWSRPVTAPITASDPAYEIQYSRVPALRGNTRFPVVAIVSKPFGNTLEFWSCKNKDANVEQADYIPHPQIDPWGGVDISPKCYRAVIYTIAAQTIAILGESNKSEIFIALAKQNMV